MHPSRFFTHSLQDARVAGILAAALEAVDPAAVVDRFLGVSPVPQASRVTMLSVGKAAIPMAVALTRHVPVIRGLVIPKHAAEGTLGLPPHVQVMPGGHPLPNENSLAAGRAAMQLAAGLEERDTLVCLISGGGSTLMSAPTISLQDFQVLTSDLLACGARIDEINTLRRHLDRVKGGGLARGTRARVLSLILSDVVSSPLEAIASGPTAPDPTTREEALRVLENYFEVSLPGRPSREGVRPGNDVHWLEPIHRAISSSPETLKPGDLIFDRVENVIVGDNASAARAALVQAKKKGFQSDHLGSDWQGEARVVGDNLANELRVAKNERAGPFCLVAGGETTVTLRGKGQGGRNQELALAAAPILARLERVMLVALATDGEDGPTDAAGAVVTGESLARARALQLDPADYLARNDSYNFFDPLGDLLKPGPTGTNVNDLIFLFSL